MNKPWAYGLHFILELEHIESYLGGKLPVDFKLIEEATRRLRVGSV
jgi:hypothetical protein